MPALRTVNAVVAAIAVGGALGGCGEEEDEAPGPAVTTRAADGLRVAGGEYFFEPDSVVLEGSGPVELTLVNEGSLAHNLRVFEGEREVGGTPTFAGGESRSAEVDLEPGSYRMVCTVGNHEELGMVGELEVR